MQTIPITLIFDDGVTHHFTAEPGEKLVDAASRAGLSLLTDCSNGQCGTCVANCVSGKLDMGHYDESVLPDDEREDGAILCCVTHVNEPAVIELPYDSSEASTDEPQAQEGVVHTVEKVAEETFRLEIEVHEPVNFLPGQYVRLMPEGFTDWRSYSMANENGQTRLVFYVRTVEGGKFSQWLLEKAAPGTRLQVSAPRGSFFLRGDGRPRLYIAGGTGLAPFLAMLNAVKAGTQAHAPTRLLIGARSGAHLFAQQELAALKTSYPDCEVMYAAEADVPEGCYQGYPTDLLAQFNVDPRAQVYVCGPPAMVDAARTAVVKAGLRKSDVLCERFA